MDEDVIDIKLAPLREKQAKCSHPSFKCSICGLYRDNVENEYVQIIRGLLLKIEELKKTQDKPVVFVSYSKSLIDTHIF